MIYALYARKKKKKGERERMDQPKDSLGSDINASLTGLAARASADSFAAASSLADSTAVRALRTEEYLRKTMIMT